MDELKKRLIFAIFLMLIVYTIGIIIYHAVEGWSWLDSLYFMTVTFTTVGYGDVIPRTEVGRMLTIAFIWVGVSIGFYMIYSISRYREAAVDPKLLAMMRRLGGIKEEKPADVSRYMEKKRPYRK